MRYYHDFKDKNSISRKTYHRKKKYRDILEKYLAAEKTI